METIDTKKNCQIIKDALSANEKAGKALTALVAVAIEQGTKQEVTPILKWCVTSLVAQNVLPLNKGKVPSFSWYRDNLNVLSKPAAKVYTELNNLRSRLVYHLAQGKEPADKSPVTPVERIVGQFEKLSDENRLAAFKLMSDMMVPKKGSKKKAPKKTTPKGE